MKKIFLVISLLVIFTTICSYAQRVFFIDPEIGMDSNNGTDPKTPWKTLEMVNTFHFQTGDQIRLKRGQEFKGWIFLSGSAINNLKLKIDAYGVGHRPLINASGNEYAILILDAGNFEISDIETFGGDKAGIFIGCTRDGQVLDHIRINNCYVHDIGDTSNIDWDYSTTTGGIVIANAKIDKQGKIHTFNSIFNDVVIDGCTVRYNRRWTCISITSGKISGTAGDSNIIRNCITEFSVADGIRMNGVKNSRIEYCFLSRNGAWPKINGRNLGGLGAWFFDAENCTIQYCEASQVGANTTDGGAFDIDYRQKNSTVQYCYGHHCAGYGVSIFGADPALPTENSVVRYNVFCHNGQDSSFVYEGDFFIFTWSGGFLNGVNVHDNLSIWDPAAPGATLKFDADFTGKNKNSFTNNILYSKQPWMVSMSSDSLNCANNHYWMASSQNGDEMEKPLWTLNNNKYHSLQEWHNATGLDAGSKYGDLSIDIPGWYKTENTGIKFRTNDKNPLLRPGQSAPEISGLTSDKQKINVSFANDELVLISFINTENKSPENLTLVRSQLVFLKSMKNQYEAKGLKVILVDVAHRGSVKNSANNAVKVFIADNAEGIPIIIDKSKNDLAVKFGVEIAPTTFLISGSGKILGNWENIVLPARLAFSIESAFIQAQK